MEEIEKKATTFLLDKTYKIVSEGIYYNSFVMALALWTGIDSVLSYSKGHSIFSERLDKFALVVFSIDFCVRIFLGIHQKFKDNSNKSIVDFIHPFFISIDAVALAPDLLEIILGYQGVNLKVLRLIRSFRLLRLTRVFLRNKFIVGGLVNIFKYKLHGQALAFVFNLVVMLFISTLFAYVNFEYVNFKGESHPYIDHFFWAMKSFTSPFGPSMTMYKYLPSKILAFLGSCMGIFVFASIISVFSSIYKKLLDVIDKGIGMVRVHEGKGEYVVIGWNHLIPQLAQHVIEGHGKKIIVLGNHELDDIRKKMSDSNLEKYYNCSLFEYEKVDYSDRNELMKLDLHNAKKIILAYDEIVDVNSKGTNGANLRDARILFTLKTIKDIFNKKQIEGINHPPIICEIFCKSNKHLFVGHENVEVLCKESLFSNIFSQSVIQDDVLNVYKRLLREDDKEIYIVKFEGKVGLTNKEYTLAKSHNEYFDKVKLFGEFGVGVLGLYYKPKSKVGRAKVFISPSLDEIENFKAKKFKDDDINNYEANFILVAEKPETIINIQENNFHKILKDAA